MTAHISLSCIGVHEDSSMLSTRPFALNAMQTWSRAVGAFASTSVPVARTGAGAEVRADGGSGIREIARPSTSSNQKHKPTPNTCSIPHCSRGETPLSADVKANPVRFARIRQMRFSSGRGLPPGAVFVRGAF